MTYFSLILSLFCLSFGATSSSLNSKCKVSDLTCIENAVNAELPKILGGIPELGIESSDPQHNEIIEANQPTLNFTLYNSTAIGFKNCIISNLKLDHDITTIHCNVKCHHQILSGQYIMNGHLVRVPVEGSGNFQLTAEKFILTLDLEIKKNQGSDGKTHLYIISFKMKAIPFNATYEFQNLFNGQKELSDYVHEYAQENWKEVAEFIQDPIWRATLTKVMHNCNKYLETIALEDVFIN